LDHSATTKSIKMSKVAVINPPSPFLIDERVFPNMGLVRVATELDKKHDVDFHDLSGIKDGESVIKEIANDYDYYLFGGTTPQFKHTHKLFKALKDENPKARTVIGGPHASAISSLRNKGVFDINTEALYNYDTIFEGEAEQSDNMFKLGWQKGDLIKSIDDVLIPDERFLDRKSYHYYLNGKETTSIQTQRGCPNQCEFCCGRDIEMYNKVRQHSPERVIKELDKLHEAGYESFMWYDDEVNINPNRLEELCDVLSTRPYQHRGFVTSDQVVKHPETIKWLKKAGFVKLCTGVESGSDRILNVIHKRANSEQNYEAARIIKDAGIHYEAFMMIGHPSENPADVARTIGWINKADPDDFDIGILTPYPGSKIYDDAVPSTKFEGYNFEYKGLYFNRPDFSKEDSYYKGLNTQSASFTRTDEMTEKYIHDKRDKIQEMQKSKKKEKPRMRTKN